MEVIIQPWEEWPRKQTSEWDRNSPFQAGYQDTLNKLQKELDHLRAQDVVIQVRCSRRDIRVDGMLRSDAHLTDPGVILAFKRNGKHPISMACDRCKSWQDNVRAIVLTLERLRLADLYGVTSSGEQYRGWEALPPPSAVPLREMTKDQAVDILTKWSGIPQDLILENPHVRTAAIKTAKLKAHPDKGGSTVEFVEVTVAAELLEKESA